MSALPLLALPDADAGSRLHRFTVLGEAEPGLLPRLIEPFAKRGLVPRHLHAVAGADGLRVSLAADLDGVTASLLAASLRATVGVATVLAEAP